MSEPFDLSECANCLCLASRRQAREITRLYDRHLRKHGLRATQFSVLAMLALTGPRPVTQLAELLGMERTTLTRGLALLERNGWVSPEPSEDSRERPVAITSAGRRKVDQAFPAWSAAQSAARRAQAKDGSSPPLPDG